MRLRNTDQVSMRMGDGSGAEVFSGGVGTINVHALEGQDKWCLGRGDYKRSGYKEDGLEITSHPSPYYELDVSSGDKILIDGDYVYLFPQNSGVIHKYNWREKTRVWTSDDHPWDLLNGAIKSEKYITVFGGNADCHIYSDEDGSMLYEIREGPYTDNGGFTLHNSVYLNGDAYFPEGETETTQYYHRKINPASGDEEKDIREGTMGYRPLFHNGKIYYNNQWGDRLFITDPDDFQNPTEVISESTYWPDRWGRLTMMTDGSTIYSAGRGNHYSFDTASESIITQESGVDRSTSPVNDGDLVYKAEGGRLVALDPQTLTEQWEVSVDGGIYASGGRGLAVTPNLIYCIGARDTDGDNSTDTILVCIDKETQTILWEVEEVLGSGYDVGGIALTNEILVYATPDKTFIYR